MFIDISNDILNVIRKVLRDGLGGASGITYLGKQISLWSTKLTSDSSADSEKCHR